MRKVSVKFPLNTDRVALTDNRFYGEGSYAYLCLDDNVQVGDLLVVPTRSNDTNLKIVEVTAVSLDIVDDRKLNNSLPLRMAIDRIDTSRIRDMQEKARKREQALKLLVIAAERESERDLFERVKARLTPEEQAQIETDLFGQSS